MKMGTYTIQKVINNIHISHSKWKKHKFMHCFGLFGLISTDFTDILPI